MTGAVFELTFDDAAILGALDRVEALLVQDSALLHRLGQAGVTSTQLRFNAQAGPDGAPWPGLSTAYAVFKGGGYDILVKSGQLRSGIHYGTGAGEVRWGSSEVYAAVHLFGATIKPKNAKALHFFLGLGGSQEIFHRQFR